MFAGILDPRSPLEACVDKRIDVIAMAIQLQATVFDLEEAELCYSLQFGSAKDPVNLAKMIAGNVMRGDLETISKCLYVSSPSRRSSPEPQSYPFTAPMVKPAMKRSRKKLYITATGRLAMRAPAINGPQRKTSPRTSSVGTPMLMVL